MQKERQVARLNIAARLEYLPEVMKLVRGISQRLGLAIEDAGRLELVVEEACANVIEHAFGPGEEGSLDVIILRRPGQVVVAVEDRGLPFDFTKLRQGRESGLGMALMKAFADEVNFINLGRQGKRVELVKNLADQELQERDSMQGKPLPSDEEPLPADTPVILRLMKPEETTLLVRCIYRSYGYTYAEGIYYPERIQEQLQSGLMTSFVAVSADGEIVGHVAITRDDSLSRVGDCGKAVVDPRYRKLGLMTRLTVSAIEHARAAGMYGLYGETVAVHTYSQKVAVAMGGSEIGALLGFIPGGVNFRNIQPDDSQLRTSILIYYYVTNQPPGRDIYPPLHHLSIISSICHRLQLKRNIITQAINSASHQLPAAAHIDVRTDVGTGWAFLSIAEFGADLTELVGFRLKELCLQHIDCIYLDLPLTHPATQMFCASLEMLGFFFGAVIPEISGGDILRLQYLNNVDVNTGEIKTATAAGRELVDYVLKWSQL